MPPTRSIRPCSVSIISIHDDLPPRHSVATVEFTAFDADPAALRNAGVRGVRRELECRVPATPSQDLSPSTSPIGRRQTAWVPARADAIAVGTWHRDGHCHPSPLVFKNHALLGNELDVNDTTRSRPQELPHLGMYQPDAIAAYEVAGQTTSSRQRRRLTGWGTFVEGSRLGSSAYVSTRPCSPTPRISM